MEQEIAIIGAGVTGISLFAQLVRMAPGAAAPLRSITLIDPNPPGSGLVFGDSDLDLLCNTSAGIQSLFPEEPTDFVDYCRTQYAAPVENAAFVPRAWVGAYARTRYQEYARLALDQGIAVVHHQARALHIAALDGRYHVHLDHGELPPFSGIAICVGLGRPKIPDGFTPHFTHPRLIRSPYPAADMSGRVTQPGSRVLVVGSGQSAIDAALLLCRDGHHVTMASRSGVLPAVRTRILPCTRDLDAINRVPSLPLDDSLLPWKLARAVVTALRAVDLLPLRHQLSASTDPVARLREETVLAETDSCRWQDVIHAVIDALNDWTTGIPVPLRNRLLAPYRLAMWRYINSLALPNARRLLAHLDSGALQLTTYDPTNVHTHDEGFQVTLRPGGRSRHFHHVVTAAGFTPPELHYDHSTVYLAQPPRQASPVRSLGRNLRLPMPTMNAIWLVGPTTHICVPIANYLAGATHQAHNVARQICETRTRRLDQGKRLCSVADGNSSSTNFHADHANASSPGFGTRTTHRRQRLEPLPQII